MTVNVQELRRVQRHIRRYPEKHEQGVWVCGTQACLAGRVALLNGWKPEYMGEDHETCTVAKGGRTSNVDSVAEEILGLSWDQALDLFFCMGTKQLHDQIDKLCEGAA